MFLALAFYWLENCLRNDVVVPRQLDGTIFVEIEVCGFHPAKLFGPIPMKAFPKGKTVMPSFNCSRSGIGFTLLALIALSALLLSSVAFAQTTVAQGSIQGTVTDPSGAVVSGAKITISNKATGQVVTTTSSSSGTYNSGGLIPGDYVVRVEAPSFKTTQLPVIVQVAVTASGNIKLEIGQASTVVEVQGAAVTVNTEQATVQGVLTGAARVLIPPRLATHRCRLTVCSGARRVSKSTAWTSAMRLSARPRRTSP